MAARVHIPSMLRSLYRTQPIEVVEASTVAEMAHALDARFPGFRERLLEPDGELRRYVGVFVNGEDVRWQAEAGSALEANAEIWIVGNVAGG